MADGGYDVTDYRDIDPLFGTLEEAEELIAEANRLGIRVIIDIVPNHCSDKHAWFRAALAAKPGSTERERFWFRPGRGANGEDPPNEWRSFFGGSAWTRTTNPDGSPGDWYLHLFASGQPDLNWSNLEVRREHEDVLRFWFDRGVAGARIDSATLLFKDAALPDFDPEHALVPHPYIDRDELHELYREWRAIADSYPGSRILVGEIWLPDRDRFARYLRPDELHTAFDFEFLACPWEAARLRAVIDATLAAHDPVGASPTWVLSNHDVTRDVTRYGRAETGLGSEEETCSIRTVDLMRGTRRARAAALLTQALPGAVCIYQGEELGLSEVEDLPENVLQDPVFFRSGGTNPGRDGCRVPLPWEGDAPPFGFSDGNASAPPWLPQPASWRNFTAAFQVSDPRSMLTLYRKALHIRRQERAFGDGPIRWLSAPANVLAFSRGDKLICVVNLSEESVELPPHHGVLLASELLDGDLLPADAAVWLRT